MVIGFTFAVAEPRQNTQRDYDDAYTDAEFGLFPHSHTPIRRGILPSKKNSITARLRSYRAKGASARASRKRARDSIGAGWSRANALPRSSNSEQPSSLDWSRTMRGSKKREIGTSLLGFSDRRMRVRAKGKRASSSFDIPAGS